MTVRTGPRATRAAGWGLAAGAALALAGCEPAPGAAVPAGAVAGAAAPASPPVPPGAGPGAQAATVAEAGALFGAACLSTRPDFAGAPAVLADLPFVRDEGTGAFRHAALALTVELVETDAGPGCSMTFVTTEEGQAAFEAFQAAADASNASNLGGAVAFENDARDAAGRTVVRALATAER